MRVLFVSSEVYPLAKTGGLADVSEALPRALAQQGADVRLLMPAYPRALEKLPRPHVIADLGGLLGVDEARLLAARLPEADLPVWLVDAPELFARDGLYQDADGKDWADNARRFAFLSHVANEIAMGRTEAGWLPDIVHCNDWHTGLVPLLLAHEEGPRPASVFTMHNMAFQGNFPAHMLDGLNLPAGCFSPEGLEYYGQASFLKAGVRFADRLTTVSPTYAREILTPEFGFGFEGLLHARSPELSGILNGADYGIWDPAADPFLPQPYDASHLNGKKVCKATVQQELGLTEAADTPLFAFISRLTEQKMADVLLKLLPHIVESGAQLAVVSEGDHGLEEKFQAVARACPGQIAVQIGYREDLAHRVQAGADMLLAPARFEPCGLSQIYAMRYGTVPIVRATGGLADTVIDTTRATISDGTATGFVFNDADVDGLGKAIERALGFYREPLAWRRLQLADMKQDFGWHHSAGQYLALYNTLSTAPRLAPLPDIFTLPPAAGFAPELEQARA